MSETYDFVPDEYSGGAGLEGDATDIKEFSNDVEEHGEYAEDVASFFAETVDVWNQAEKVAAGETVDLRTLGDNEKIILLIRGNESPPGDRQLAFMEISKGEEGNLAVSIRARDLSNEIAQRRAQETAHLGPVRTSANIDFDNYESYLDIFGSPITDAEDGVFYNHSDYTPEVTRPRRIQNARGMWVEVGTETVPALDSGRTGINLTGENGSFEASIAEFQMPLSDFRAIERINVGLGERDENGQPKRAGRYETDLDEGTVVASKDGKNRTALNMDKYLPEGFGLNNGMANETVLEIRRVRGTESSGE